MQAVINSISDNNNITKNNNKSNNNIDNNNNDNQKKMRLGKKNQEMEVLNQQILTQMKVTGYS